MSTHLATCPNCGAEMDVTEVGPYTRVRCPGCGEEVRVKTEMGGYRLTRRIAFGGMSVVYAARDPTLKRGIAVKVLSEEFSADAKREEQFEREAKRTAAVSHPNVVRVFKVGRAFGRFFIAMELVPGQSLEERMAIRGALPENEVIGLALQVVEGLRAAQASGLIHRDIKPGNILIDEKETAKIVDFGLSLLAEGGEVRAEELWGTPYYVAPEALDHAEEDHRSDMYALGATLYHALTGVCPFEAKETSTRVLKEAKRRIAPLKKVAPWLSAEMVRTVEKAMAYDRKKRFATYEEFRLALETTRGVLEAKGERYPVHGAVRAQRRERQQTHRKAWLAGGIVLGTILAVAAAFLAWKVGGQKEADVPEKKGVPKLGVGGGGELDLDPATAQEINQAYERGREALADDDYGVAEEQFLRVRGHAKAPGTTAAWAGFEAAVAAYLDGRSGDARRHLLELPGLLAERREADTAMGRRLLAVIEPLTALAHVPEASIPQVLEDPFRATAMFALALKTWEQGQLERASGLFARFEQAGPWAEAEWMRNYQKLAGRYVSDYRRLSEVSHGVAGKNRSQVREAIAELEELYGSLRTRGRARFNVKVWQSELRGRLRELQNRRVDPEWEALRGEVAAMQAAGEFGRAAVRLRAAMPGGELESRQRVMLLGLSEAADGLLKDMRRALASGADGVKVRAKSGAEFTGILGTQESGLLVEENGAAKSIAWVEIEPGSLLETHRYLVDRSPDGEERARRWREAVAYAWLSGLETEAQGLARELVGMAPEYEKEWNELVEVLEEAEEGGG